MGDDLIDDRHHDQRGHDGQEAERQRRDQKVAERLLLLQHHLEQPADSERRIGFGSATLGPQQNGLAAPHFGEAEFVDHDRRVGFRCAWVLQRDNLGFGVRAGEQPSGAVVEQEDDRASAAEMHEMAPAQP